MLAKGCRRRRRRDRSGAGRDETSRLRPGAHARSSRESSSASGCRSSPARDARRALAKIGSISSGAGWRRDGQGLDAVSRRRRDDDEEGFARALPITSSPVSLYKNGPSYGRPSSPQPSDDEGALHPVGVAAAFTTAKLSRRRGSRRARTRSKSIRGAGWAEAMKAKDAGGSQVNRGKDLFGVALWPSACEVALPYVQGKFPSAARAGDE
jgi:hypothetical protein